MQKGFGKMKIKELLKNQISEEDVIVIERDTREVLADCNSYILYSNLYYNKKAHLNSYKVYNFRARNKCLIIEVEKNVD